MTEKKINKIKANIAKIPIQIRNMNKFIFKTQKTIQKPTVFKYFTG